MPRFLMLPFWNAGAPHWCYSWGHGKKGCTVAADYFPDFCTLGDQWMSYSSTMLVRYYFPKDQSWEEKWVVRERDNALSFSFCIFWILYCIGVWVWTSYKVLGGSLHSLVRQNNPLPAWEPRTPLQLQPKKVQTTANWREQSGRTGLHNLKLQLDN